MGFLANLLTSAPENGINTKTMALKIKENLILEKITVDKTLVRYDFSFSKGLAPYFTTNVMYVEYDSDVSSLPESILAIPFVGSLIALTWATDSILWVKEIDETYFDSLKAVKTAYQELYSHFPLGGRFVAAYKRKNRHIDNPGSNRAIVLFSGGIDAHTTYVRNRHKDLCLCNIQGWLDKPGSESEAQKADFRDVKNFADKEHCTASLIKSNFALLVNSTHFSRKIGKKLHDSWWHGFLHSMAFISLAIPVAAMNGIPEIIIASSHSIGSKGVCASYPTTDAEFRYAANGYVTHDSFELTRQDKVRQIVAHQKATGKPYPIRVCSFNDHNCCVCPKCFRTILEIISEGGDIKQFGFEIPGNMKRFYQDYIKTHFIEFGIQREALLFWPDIKERIRQNIDIIEEKEFVEWFLVHDFVGERKKAVLRYRIRNFFPLLLKKIRSHG